MHSFLFLPFLLQHTTTKHDAVDEYLRKRIAFNVVEYHISQSNIPLETPSPILSHPPPPPSRIYLIIHPPNIPKSPPQTAHHCPGAQTIRKYYRRVL